MKKNYTSKLFTVTIFVMVLIAIQSSIFAQSCQLSTAGAATYNGGWSGGQNDNSNGFGAWSFSNTSGNGGQNGAFIGNSGSNGSGSNASPNTPNINTSNRAWALYANSSQTASATRDFTNALAIGHSLSLSLDNGFIDNGGTVGISLQNASGNNLMEFYFIGGTTGYTVNDANTVVTGIGFTDRGLDLTITRTGNSTYNLSVFRKENSSTTNFTSRTFFNPAGGQVPTRIRFFNFNAGGGDQRNVFFNNLNICRPTLSSTGTLTALNTTYGTASSNTSFSFSGENMFDAATISAPAGFQVSTNATSGFASSISVGAAGTIASTTIFVRVAANTSFGNYSGNIVISSTGATNVNVATVISSVSAAPLTITGITANNKNYNGNTTATIAGTASYLGLQNSESFTVTGTPTATFNTANAGTAKPITVVGYTAPNANYSITQPTGLTADIIAAPLTITGITANNKNYNGNTTATLAGSASYVGLQNSESFTVTGTPTATFNTANAGTAKPVTVIGYSAPNANYSITQPTGLTADIIAAPLTITGITANNKIYDGNTTATLAGTASYAGLQNSESFTVTGTPTATFNTANAGNAKPVNVIGYTAPNANYSITQPTGLTADIIGLPIGTANFRSKNSGNFSSITTWQYDQGGNDYVDATQAPTGNNNISIQNGHTVTLDVNFTIPTGKTINLDATSSLVINPTSRLTIAGTADFNNQSVTLQSTNAGTASIGQITGSLLGATNVTVERYIPANTLRAWRLLAVATKGSQTIKQAWQEGQAQLANNNAGYGTIITSNISSSAALLGAGFDAFTTSPSMQRYGTGAWVNITNTNVAIESDKAYFLYIRGSRAITPSTATSAVDATTLRTTGTLYQGAVTVNTAGSFTPIANVYASSVDFTQLTRSGVSNTFYLWDAKKASGAVLGAYQTFSGTAGFQCIPGGGSFTPNQVNTTIQSGQGFFVSGVGSVTFNESAKVSGSSLAGYRPATPVSALVKIDSRLYNSSNSLVDANVVVFNNNYANAVDADDAVKYTNPAENFGIVTNNTNLVVEGRKPITADDVINFNVSNLKEQTYTVEFTAANMSNSNLEAQLVDKYLGTSTPVDITGVTKVSFTVNADAGSKAANRFSLVFKAKPTVPTITKSGIVVSPNPVEGSSMNLQFANQAAGKYTVRILNLQGKAITTAIVNHTGGSSNQVISLSSKVAAGMYKVEVIGADKTRTVQSVFVQ